MKMVHKLAHMRKGVITGITLFILLALAVACRHHPEDVQIVDDNGGGNGTVNPPDTIIVINPDPCDPDTVYFTNTIAPLLNAMCASDSCHDAVDPEEEVQLTDYTHIMEEVDAGDPDNSRLYRAITEDDDDERMPPINSPQLTNEEILLIETWIAQGARNNSCQPDCNPDDFSFSSNIQPVVSAYCEGCHGGSSPSGDLALETYDQIKTIALDGRLMDALYGTNNVTLMPDNTTGLPECNISNFQNWVDAGAPNN
jgi:uncharacterized membrane protein